MRRTHLAPRAAADPFGEARRPRLVHEADLLGCRFVFETDSASLLRIVRCAYQGLPAHALAGRKPTVHVRLVLTPEPRRRRAPPLVRALAAPAILCGANEGSGFAVICAAERAALIVVPRQLLRFPYNIRYELLEFAVYTLAARVQGLVPLHAACIGRAGRGLLLMGSSGAGKSTLTMHCVRQGLEFLAEDSVLVQPHTLRATGIASFLHLRADSLRFLDPQVAAAVRRAPVIRRRSGVQKYELDLRQPGYCLARAPLPIAATVFLSAAPPARQLRLRSLGERTVAALLNEAQPYAAAQPGWSLFRERVVRLPAFELCRGRHPLESVAALTDLLPTARR